MATQEQIDWTVTIETHGVLVMENDVRVSVSVCGDGEVFIDQVDIIKWGKTVKLGEGCYHRPVDELVPFSTSDEPWLSALSGKAMEVLSADERLCARARDRAGLIYVGCGPNDPDGGFKRQMESA